MRNLMRVLVLLAALSIVGLGILGGSVGTLISLLGLSNNEAEPLVMVTFGMSLLTVMVGLGLILAWHAWRAIQGYPSSIFRPRRIGLWGLAFVLAVLLGHMVLSLDLLPVVTFPILHIAAAILPPLIILALVGRGLGAVSSLRDVILQTASGAFLSTPLAFGLEATAILAFSTATLAGVAIRPGGQALLQRMATYLEDPTWFQDPTALAPAFMSPVIVAAATVFVSGVIPLIEEAVKTVGVGLMAYRRPTLPQTLLWGLAGGAGFALVEGLLNTSGGLEAWTPVILLRVGATLLHCFTGALMGLAWYNVLSKRRWLHGLGLYTASVAVHSLWNALSIGMALFSLGAIDSDITGADQMATGLGIVTILALLVVLAVVMALGLLGLTNYTRKHSPAAGSPETRPAPPIIGTNPIDNVASEG